jgi:hypothetical protein
MLRSAKELQGFKIGATDGAIGTVDALYFDDVSFTVRHLVVDTGGWLPGKRVLISPIAVRSVDGAERRIDLNLTKRQIEASPDISTDPPVSQQVEAEYYRYYGYAPYWTGPYVWGPVPYPGAVMAPTTPGAFERERRWDWTSSETGDRHLRSSKEIVDNYTIRATDGDIGHVDDFLVDDESWSIRYMVVDTRNWWPGKRVLVAPDWIERVEWGDGGVYVDLTREHIKNSPQYDSSHPLEREYETRLHQHYRRPGYWHDRA